MNISKFSERIKKATTPLKGSIPTVRTYRLSVKKKFEGMTILDFYTKAMPSISRDIWKEKIESDNLTVNGKNVSIEYIVKAGDKTKHFSKPQTEPDINTNIELIEWNDDFLVINKPAPLPVHPGGRFEKNTLTEILKIAFPDGDFKLVHRIDANTTGLVVIAKNSKTAKEIIDQFKDQSVTKEYLVLVEGIIHDDYLALNQMISKELTPSGGREISDDGKKAMTKIKTIIRFPNQNQTILSVSPNSGRTNQIRIHLANAGFPIVGDIGYKDAGYFKKNPLTYKEDCLYLHAWKLSFFYQNKQFSFTAPLPLKFTSFNLHL